MTPEEFIAIWQNIEPPKPIFYRLYYDDQGRPLCYTMEDLPGKYIDVDQETYIIAPGNVRVVNEKLIKINPPIIVRKLKPSTTGTSCDPNNVCIIVDDSNPHIKWKLTTNETN